ncbi:hypothetical protein [Actinoplanes sp. NPDC049599]|uniref:hypothetical protein n=1 Tax=Actinoplanes sp. NPDC049599 TaxID=3363903 RepID=UPI0037899986
MKTGTPSILRLVAVGAALATVPLAAPAEAAAAPPPACATLTKNATATVLTVRNTCATSVRLRLIISPTVTTGCALYAPGTVRVITVPTGAPSARLEAC